MTHARSLIRLIPALLLGFVLTGLLATPASAQITEQEPNNPCASAQNIGAATFPAVVNGNLTSTPQNPDVDFFKFTAPPNTLIEATLEGAQAGVGTLQNPLLGLFNSNCFLFADTTGPKLTFLVPDDGVFIMAVTACCDFQFIGGGVGTYRLTVDRFHSIGSISGRVVDAVTGNPLTSFGFPFTSILLRRCSNGQCFEIVASAIADQSGRYRIDHPTAGIPLGVGTYQLSFSAQTYVSGQTAPFFVGEDQNIDLGDFQMTPLPRAGSISGRLVDANTRRPLSGTSFPFASAQLIGCEQFGCFNDIVGMTVDNLGKFRFDRMFNGGPLLAGRYSIRGSGQSYLVGQTAPFDVGENENRDIGDVLVPPFPVRIFDVRPCNNVPAAGGSCSFSVSLTNGLPTTLNAKTWTIVSSFSTGTFLGSTNFQPPDPPIVSIPTAATRAVTFRFEVPGSLREGALICPNVFVGQSGSASQTGGDKNAAYFNTLASSNSFCIFKQFGQLRVLTEQESRPLLLELENQRLLFDQKKP